MPQMTKTQQVLVLDETVIVVDTDEPLSPVYFQNLHDEGETTRTQLLMQTGDYEAMGRPDRITVTIEPGDLLNE